MSKSQPDSKKAPMRQDGLSTKTQLKDIERELTELKQKQLERAALERIERLDQAKHATLLGAGNISEMVEDTDEYQWLEDIELWSERG